MARPAIPASFRQRVLVYAAHNSGASQNVFERAHEDIVVLWVYDPILLTASPHFPERVVVLDNVAFVDFSPEFVL